MRVGGSSWQIRRVNAEACGEASQEAEWLIPGSQEKPLSFRQRESVPETDTGGRGEYPQAFETTRVKELGKIVP